MNTTALVPLYSGKRFLFTWKEGRLLIFDAVRCGFIHPVWVSFAQVAGAAYYDRLISKDEVLIQKRGLDEVLEGKREFDSWVEGVLRHFACVHGVPYDLLTRPRPEARERKQGEAV